MRLYSTIHSGIGLNLSNICDETMDSFKYARVFHSVVLYMRFAIVQLHVYPILVAISSLSLVTVHLDPILRMKNIENNTCSVI